MLLPYKEGLIITGNMCTIWLYSDTETRDSGWRAVAGYDLVRSATVSSDRLIHYFTEEHRGRPRWSQGAFKLCAAADLPHEGKGQKCAFFCVLICRVDKEVLETEQKEFKVSSDGKQVVVEVYQGHIVLPGWEQIALAGL